MQRPVPRRAVAFQNSQLPQILVLVHKVSSSVAAKPLAVQSIADFTNVFAIVNGGGGLSLSPSLCGKSDVFVATLGSVAS
jgi:hypothetical protein